MEVQDQGHRQGLWYMVCGEEGEHKEKGNGISGKCGLYMQGLRFSVNDFVWVTGETSDSELRGNEHPQAVGGRAE